MYQIRQSVFVGNERTGSTLGSDVYPLLSDAHEYLDLWAGAWGRVGSPVSRATGGRVTVACTDEEGTYYRTCEVVRFGR